MAFVQRGSTGHFEPILNIPNDALPENRPLWRRVAGGRIADTFAGRWDLIDYLGGTQPLRLVDTFTGEFWDVGSSAEAIRVMKGQQVRYADYTIAVSGGEYYDSLITEVED